MMSFIDQLGVNNIIIEAREALDRNELQTVRSISPGLSFRDYRAISENVSGLVAITPRKKFKPQKLLPKTTQEAPQLSACSRILWKSTASSWSAAASSRKMRIRARPGLCPRGNRQGQSAGL